MDFDLSLAVFNALLLSLAFNAGSLCWTLQQGRGVILNSVPAASRPTVKATYKNGGDAIRKPDTGNTAGSAATTGTLSGNQILEIPQAPPRLRSSGNADSALSVRCGAVFEGRRPRIRLVCPSKAGITGRGSELRCAGSSRAS